MAEIVKRNLEIIQKKMEEEMPKVEEQQTVNNILQAVGISDTKSFKRQLNKKIETSTSYLSKNQNIYQGEDLSVYFKKTGHINYVKNSYLLMEATFIDCIPYDVMCMLEYVGYYVNKVSIPQATDNYLLQKSKFQELPFDELIRIQSGLGYCNQNLSSLQAISTVTEFRSYQRLIVNTYEQYLKLCLISETTVDDVIIRKYKFAIPLYIFSQDALLNPYQFSGFNQEIEYRFRVNNVNRFCLKTREAAIDFNIDRVQLYHQYVKLEKRQEEMLMKYKIPMYMQKCFSKRLNILQKDLEFDFNIKGSVIREIHIMFTPRQQPAYLENDDFTVNAKDYFNSKGQVNLSSLMPCPIEQLSFRMEGNDDIIIERSAFPSFLQQLQCDDFNCNIQDNIIKSMNCVYKLDCSRYGKLFDKGGSFGDDKTTSFILALRLKEDETTAIQSANWSISNDSTCKMDQLNCTVFVITQSYYHLDKGIYV